MNIKELLAQEKPGLATSQFISELSIATAIHMLQGGKFKTLITNTSALLFCMEGETFENENGIKETLMAGDFVNIEPMSKHRAEGTIENQLLHIK